MAPITAVNTSETERLREEAARQKLLEVQDDPSFYQINPAVVMIVEENVTGVLNLLRQGIASEAPQVEEEGAEEVEAPPTPLTVSEIDRRLIRDYQI